MKTVFQNSELAHVWASQQQSHGKANSFYFDGATIYSYGRHFPIATIVGQDVLFTMRTYSNTTAKHVGMARRAISHLNVIWCYDVPVNLKYASSEHENNLNRWAKNIKSLFAEIGNKKNRDIAGRMSSINREVAQMETYCQYFKIKVQDKEVKAIMKDLSSPDFVKKATQAKEHENELKAKKLAQAAKSYEKYITLWRAYNTDAINDLPAKDKELCNFYRNHTESFTHLRFNSAHNRVETSKGIEIPAHIAKRAYNQLLDCINGSCKDIAVPVLHYTITETTKDYIKAGCHTIPKTDVQYIATLLNWK